MASTPKLIQSVARAAKIIECFTEDTPRLTLNEISKQTEININTARGIVQTLVYYNYLSYDTQERVYRLGLIFSEKSALSSMDLTERMIPVLDELMQSTANELGVSLRLISVDGSDTANVFGVNPRTSRYILNIRENVGFPLHASATGKLILSNMKKNKRDTYISGIEWKGYGRKTIEDTENLKNSIKEVIEKGYSYEDEELGFGFSSIAIPIYDKSGEIIYTLSSTGISEIMNDNKMDIFSTLKEMREKVIQKFPKILQENKTN